MARRLVILVDLDELPKLILESAQTCFGAHRVQLYIDGKPLTIADTATRMHEMSNNVAAAIAATGEVDMDDYLRNGNGN